MLCYPKPGVAADELSQCTFLVHVVLRFSCKQALGPKPSSRDTSSVAAPLRDTLAAEPAQWLSYSARLMARASIKPLAEGECLGCPQQEGAMGILL